MNDDASSLSSMNSYKCSNFLYYDSGNNESEHGPTVGAELHKQPKCTIEARNFAKQYFNWYPTTTMDSCGCRCGGGSSLRPTRIRSNVEDRRSMQLRRSLLLGEMYKYKTRMFNTVGAVEGIGFQHIPDRGRSFLQ